MVWKILAGFGSTAFSQQPDNFPSFTSWVGGTRFQFFDQLKIRCEEHVEFFPSHRKGGTASLWLLARIPGIQVEYRQQGTPGLQGAEDSTDIILTVPGFDCTKAGVLKNPCKPVCQFQRKMKKVRQLIGLHSSESESAGLVDCVRCDVQTNYLRSR